MGDGEWEKGGDGGGGSGIGNVNKAEIYEKKREEETIVAYGRALRFNILNQLYLLFHHHHIKGGDGEEDEKQDAHEEEEEKNNLLQLARTHITHALLTAHSLTPADARFAEVVAFTETLLFEKEENMDMDRDFSLLVALLLSQNQNAQYKRPFVSYFYIIENKNLMNKLFDPDRKSVV